MNKELRMKTTEELCALIVRLKLQLLESRFRMASGELEKLHTLPEIRKTIARAMTILNERNIKLTIGTHGVTMINTKTNECKSITDLVNDVKEEQKAKANIKEATAKVAKAEVAEEATAENKIEAEKVPAAKKEPKARITKAKTATKAVRRTQGA